MSLSWIKCSVLVVSSLAWKSTPDGHILITDIHHLWISKSTFCQRFNFYNKTCLSLVPYWTRIDIQTCRDVRKSCTVPNCFWVSTEKLKYIIWSWNTWENGDFRMQVTLTLTLIHFLHIGRTVEPQYFPNFHHNLLFWGEIKMLQAQAEKLTMHLRYLWHDSSFRFQLCFYECLYFSTLEKGPSSIPKCWSHAFYMC